MYLVRILARSDVCHWACAGTVLQTVQKPGVYYGTVHYIELMKSFDKSRAYLLI